MISNALCDHNIDPRLEKVAIESISGADDNIWIKCRLENSIFIIKFQIWMIILWLYGRMFVFSGYVQ